MGTTTRAAAAGASEASAVSVRSAQDKEALANRFDNRAARLRRQANIFLTIIIIVLLAGATGFVFANDIASLNFRPQTAAAQYAAAEATWKQDEDEQTALDKRVHEIQDGTVIAKPFDDRITAVKDDLSKSEERQLESCKDLTFVRKFDPWQQNELSVTFSQERIGEYQFATVDRVIFFANGGAATECKDRLQRNLGEAVILHQRQLQDITRERDAAVDEFRRSKAEEVAPLLKNTMIFLDR